MRSDGIYVNALAAHRAAGYRRGTTTVLVAGVDARKFAGKK
jgi:hypothetical protein